LPAGKNNDHHHDHDDHDHDDHDHDDHENDERRRTTTTT
jgi:hypothetical protein